MLTIAAWLLLAAVAHADALVTTIVTNPLTGVALEGYDPVSYFIDREPHMGKPDFEYQWQGVPWYFESAANRDAFIQHPEVYAPQYGGHCVMSLSRGFLSDGKPLLFTVVGLKLYLFYSTDNRDAFLLSPGAALTDAARNWPNLEAQLSGTPAERTVATNMTAVPPSGGGGAAGAGAGSSVAAADSGAKVSSN